MESPSGNNATFGKDSLHRKIYTKVNFVLMRGKTQPRQPQKENFSERQITLKLSGLTSICYLRVSVAQLGACGSVFLRRLRSTSKRGWERIHLPGHSCGSGPCWLLRHRVLNCLSTEQPTTWRLASLRASEQPGRHTGLCDLILKETSPHFCYILFILLEYFNSNSNSVH